MPVTKIERIEIAKFRLFDSIAFPLGDKITVIAGHNATGKSTLLGLLGHSAELRGRDKKPLIHSKFGTEFREIIKASHDFDPRTSLAYTIYFRNNNTDSLSFRTGWQTYKNAPRFRIIPKRTEERPSERKLEWPTLYLGLSRLYPVGESKQAKPISIRLTETQKNALFSAQFDILSLNERPRDYTGITLSEKKTLGVQTDTYDYVCNSAGQDNLSQIIMAVLSFESLKQKLGTEWDGGLLLIDELDAALHPAAQYKLFSYLYRSCNNLGIQVVFTTHSLSLLETVCRNISRNDDEINDIELIYITTRNRAIELLRNVDYTTLFFDLQNLVGSDTNLRKITVYTEDNEARWFLNKLIGPVVNRVDLPIISLGYDNLLDFYKSDPKHFRDVIFVLDGDVPDDKIEDTKRKLPFRRVKNILKLPTDGQSPETIFYQFLDDIPEYETLRAEVCATEEGLSHRTIIETYGPQSFTQYTESRRQYKAWFNRFINVMEVAYPHWERQNREIVEAFRSSFIEAYNDCAQRLRLPGINSRLPIQ